MASVHPYQSRGSQPALLLLHRSLNAPMIIGVYRSDRQLRHISHFAVNTNYVTIEQKQYHNRNAEKMA